MASGLGLRQDPGRSRGSAYNYNWMHGGGHGRQVEVRIGRNEEYFKGLSFGSQKHMRQVVWVRVQAPDFELVGERGRLRLSDSSPAAVRETVARWADEWRGAAKPLRAIAARVQVCGWHVQLQLDGREFTEREALIRRFPGTLVIDHTGKFLEPVAPDHAAFKVLLRP